MTTKRWDFQDEDMRRYSVEVEHNVLSGDRRIIVNEREVFRGGKFSDTGGAHAFDVDGHSARLHIGSNGFTYAYHLIVGGLTIPPEGATIPRAPRAAQTDVGADDDTRCLPRQRSPSSQRSRRDQTKRR